MDTTTIIIVANLCNNGGYILIKLGNAFIAFGRSLKDPNKKALKKQNKITKLQTKTKLDSINKQPEVKSIS